MQKYYDTKINKTKPNIFLIKLSNFAPFQIFVTLNADPADLMFVFFILYLPT